MGSLAVASNIALADCTALPSHATLKAALIAAQAQDKAVSAYICGAPLSIETASFAP